MAKSEDGGECMTQYYCFNCDEASEADRCPSCGGITEEVDNLSYFTLQSKRQHIIDKVNAPLLKDIITLARELKIEPTKQNTHLPNSHVLIDAFDELFLSLRPGREPLFRAMRNLTVYKHESDPFYQNAMNIFLELLVEAILKGEWAPRPLACLPGYLRVEPQYQGGVGYEFIRDRYYHAEKYQEVKGR